MTTISRRVSPAQLLAQGGPAATKRVREAERPSREGSLNPRHNTNLTYHKATRSFTPEPEISFGRDPLDAFDVQPKSATRRSGSSVSSDLPELHTEIQKLLRGVLTQINPATPSMNSGSYSSNMGLKRLKEKLESLDRLNRMLEERSQALAEAEAQLEARLSDVTQRQRDFDLSSGSPHTRALEAELSETKALLAMYRQENASPDSVRRRLTFDSIQSSERDTRFDTDRSLAELRSTAEMLERKTVELIKAQKDVEMRVRRL